MGKHCGDGDGTLSFLVGRVDGACMMESLALRRKSPEPPGVNKGAVKSANQSHALGAQCSPQLAARSRMRHAGSPRPLSIREPITRVELAWP